MADNNEVIKALGQVPELVEKTERVLEDSDKKFRILAEATQKRMQAEIPSSEIEKVYEAAAAAVSRTSCPMPDTSVLSRQIADEVRGELAKDIDTHVSDTVSSTIAKTKVKTETVHTFLPSWEIAKMAEEKTRKLNAILAAVCGTMFIWVIVGLFAYFNSEEYWGRQYWGIYSSKYITEAEKKAIHDNASTYSIVPKEFYSNKSLAKSKIRRNKEILSLREAEVKKNKGKFSTKTPIE